MERITPRRLLELSVPLIIAIVVDYFWFRKKRIGARSDPGDQETAAITDASVDTNRRTSIPLDIEQNSTRRNPLGAEGPYPSAPCAIADTPPKLSSVEGSPSRNFSRSYSAPIPIVLPKELRSTRTLNISDEELDQQIEKLKSSVVNTDPFKLINQGKIINCVSPSQKSRSSSSPSQQILVNASPELLTPTIVATCGEDNQEVVQEISNSKSFEKTDPTISEKVEDIAEKEISNSESFEKTDEKITEKVEVDLEIPNTDNFDKTETIIAEEVEDIVEVEIPNSVNFDKTETIIAEEVEEIVQKEISNSESFEKTDTTISEKVEDIAEKEISNTESFEKTDEKITEKVEVEIPNSDNFDKTETIIAEEIVEQTISNSETFEKTDTSVAQEVEKIIEQEISKSESSEKTDSSIAEKVEEIVEQEESIVAIDTIVDKEVEEIIAKKDFQQEAISPVAILEINPSLNIEVSVEQTDSTTDKMTSTIDNIISGDAEKVQEMTSNQSQVSPSVCTEKVDEINLNNEEAKAVQDCITEDDLDETLTEEKINAVDNITSFDENRPSSAEERPSSAEERPSSAEERPSSAENRPSSAEDVPSSGEDRPSSSAEPVPSTSTGAIPKQKKKKKFRKLNCDLKDVGAKLMVETQKKSTNKAPKKNGQKSRNESGCETEDTHPQNSRRQSSNPSPDDMLFVSSSLSSLNESEGSHDSGKGGSDDNPTPPPQPELEPSTKVEEENPKSFYEFLLNKDLVGKLIGKRGCFVNSIYTKTNAHVIVKDHPNDTKNKICIVDGTEEAIKKAMKMIRQRFPREKLEQFVPQEIALGEPFYIPQLMLPAATNMETQISCMVTPNHLFLQQQFHPTFPHFMQMHAVINFDYESDEVPLIQEPITENTICVAYTFQSWNRAQILSVDEENKTAYVRAMDFGGYAYVPFSKLKQLRSDLMCLPFQATECFLANIEPVGGEWCQDAYTLVSNLTCGAMLYTHVVAFTEDNIPLVNCQVICNNQPIWINLELVKQGYAKWSQEAPSTTTEVDTRIPVEC